MGKLLVKIIITAIIIITFINLFEAVYPPSQVKYGVSFSPGYAKHLGLDWQKTYLQILDELKVSNLRLPSYWDVLEGEPQKYDFSETDFMLSEAEKRGAKVILVVGARQPRWPECHIPEWAKDLTIPERQQKTLDFIQKVIVRYQHTSAVWAWQVENEPFAFWFGSSCDPPDKNFLQQEVNLVKSLDHREVILTDSGEWGIWVDAISPADILGISVYRKSYNPTLNLYITYPFPAGMYSLKTALIKALSGNQNKQVIVTELQAEPWLSGRDPKENSPQRQSQLFSLADFKTHIEYAKKTGFDEHYLWGVEWWYWMDKNGFPQYLDYARSLFR